VNIRIKKYIVSGLFLFVGYFLASQHIVINKKDFRLLEKSELTYEYTFYNLTDREPGDVLRIDVLRENGIGDVMVELGLLSEEEKNRWETYYNSLYD
jgi:hypothetical protein